MNSSSETGSIIRCLSLRAQLNQMQLAANDDGNQELVMRCDYLRDQLDKITDVIYQCESEDEGCSRPYCVKQHRRRVMKNFGTEDDEAIYERIFNLVEALLETRPSETIEAGLFWGLATTAAIGQCKADLTELGLDNNIDTTAYVPYHELYAEQTA